MIMLLAQVISSTRHCEERQRRSNLVFKSELASLPSVARNDSVAKYDTTCANDIIMQPETDGNSTSF